MNAKIIAVLSLLLAGPAVAVPLDLQTVNDAQWRPRHADKGISPVLVKAQVLLARAGFSPGEIDGRPGDNFQKAVEAFADMQGLRPTQDLNQDVWDKLAGSSPDGAIVQYTLNEDDVSGPFAERIPHKMEDMKTLPALSYTSPVEKIAEKFHMSESLLKALNPGQRFDAAGETIIVAYVPPVDLTGRIAKIDIDKTRQVLRASDADGRLVAFYPVTVGSAEKPAPDGTLKITTVKKNPTYRYNPDYRFKGVHAKEPFTIKPGPNNPVGVVWIGLSAQGYGIHGTPDPGNVGKSQSHGCVRLTNWDALQLAAAAKKGIPVEFTGDERAAHNVRITSSKERRRR